MDFGYDYEELVKSRFIIEDNNTLGFTLPIHRQWFAAQHLAKDILTTDDLIKDPERLEHWRYSIIIAVGTLGGSKINDIIAPIARNNPGFAAEVVEDALSKWNQKSEINAPPIRECGQRIRDAMKAWVEGLENLSSIIAPIMSDGNILPLGIKSIGPRLAVSWYRGTKQREDIINLESEELSYQDWPSTRFIRPGRQSGWAWRFTLEQLRDNLFNVLERPDLLCCDELEKEKIWVDALVLMGYSRFHYEAIQIDDLDKRLQNLPDSGFFKLRGHICNITALRHNLEILRNNRINILTSPWSGPDIKKPQRWIWMCYSEGQLLKRAQEIYSSALHAYTSIVKKYFPRFAQRLPLAASFPVRLVIDLYPPQPERGYAGQPCIDYLFEPLEPHKSSHVDIKIREKRVDHTITLDLLARLLRERRASKSQWIPATVYRSILDIFGPRSVTIITFNWLANDLHRVCWLDRLLNLHELDTI